MLCQEALPWVNVEAFQAVATARYEQTVGAYQQAIELYTGDLRYPPLVLARNATPRFSERYPGVWSDASRGPGRRSYTLVVDHDEPKPEERP